MSGKSLLSPPGWVDDTNRALFTIRAAALYHNEDGSIGQLSEALGGSRSMLHMAIKKGGLTTATCIKLEEMLGRETFPREFFRPDLFA